MKAGNRLQGLDLLRLLSAFLVVTIHYPPETQNPEILIAFCRVAVPIFFMINGFFGVSANDIPPEKCRLRMKKLGFLIVINIIAYTLYDIALHLSEHAYSMPITDLAEWKYYFMPVRIITFLFFNDPGAAIHCWYMLALIYTYIIIMLFQKIGKSSLLYKWTPFLALAHYFIRFAAQCIIPQYNYGFLYRNWLFMALPFFSMGVVIGRAYRNNREWFTARRKMFIILCVAALPLYFAEVQATHKLTSAYFEVYISTIALSVLLFLVAITSNFSNKILRALSIGGLRYSTSIYCCHFMIGSLIALLINLFLPSILEIYGMLKPVIVFLISLVSSIIYDVFKQFYKKKRSLHTYTDHA